MPSVNHPARTPVQRGITLYEGVMGMGLQVKSFTLVPTGALKPAVQEAAQFFEQAYEQVDREITYNIEWSNGHHYFSRAQHDPVLYEQLGTGQLAKCTDENDRKMILIGTRYGAVVVFQRYTNDSSVLVFDAPPEVKRCGLFHGVGMLNIADLQALFGIGNNLNIGTRIEMLPAAELPPVRRTEFK